jgi:hypothetical protein
MGMIGYPKSTALRNPHLLAMARGQDCNMQVPGICNRNPETVVAAHSNSHVHGKAGARKADDCYVVYACSSCHSWLDQGYGAIDKDMGLRALQQGMVRQVRQWVDICYNPTAKQKDRDAAKWALECLMKHGDFSQEVATC